MRILIGQLIKITTILIYQISYLPGLYWSTIYISLFISWKKSFLFVNTFLNFSLLQFCHLYCTFLALTYLPSTFLQIVTHFLYILEWPFFFSHFLVQSGYNIVQHDVNFFIHIPSFIILFLKNCSFSPIKLQYLVPILFLILPILLHFHSVTSIFACCPVYPCKKNVNLTII